MRNNATSRNRLRILGGCGGIVGVCLIGVSFAVNAGPPPHATDAELIAFARGNFHQVLWGAWLQTIGPVLIIGFALALVHLAGARDSFWGWMTLTGSSVLMTVSLIEITFYISALNLEPPGMPRISLALIAAVQHLYFIIAAPALFLPLGIVLLNSTVLPRIFGGTAVLLSGVFATLGVLFLFDLALPPAVTAVGAVQAIWWLAAGVALIAVGRSEAPL